MMNFKILLLLISGDYKIKYLISWCQNEKKHLMHTPNSMMTITVNKRVPAAPPATTLVDTVLQQNLG